jgi:ABC-type Fe3+/spermidine/putrescine transport system ATPase subunit
MIELRNVTKRYGQILANNDVTLDILHGELMTLLGPSGCGKTTALRCITGQVTPDEGRVFIDGVDVTDLPTHKRELGMVFQNFALFPHMSVFENVEFPLMIRSLPKEQRRGLVMDTLKLIRMETYAEQYPRQLSGGQQQRVGLARALVYHPKVLLLDEPLSNLDAKLREEMRFEIKDLIRRLSITGVYVTHDQAEALAMSDRVAVMNAGHIEQVGTPDEIYECPRSKFVADFIGLSNFIRGKVLSVVGQEATVAVDGLRLVVPATAETQVGQEWLIFVRPNDIDLLPNESSEALNVLDGTVSKLTYLGDRIHRLCRLVSACGQSVKSADDFLHWSASCRPMMLCLSDTTPRTLSSHPLGPESWMAVPATMARTSPPGWASAALW